MPPPIRCGSHSTYQAPPHQSLPPRGKVARRKPGRMRGQEAGFPTSGKRTDVAAPHQSKIKDFCQLLPREKPNPLRHGLRRATSPRGRGKGCGVPSPARSAACCRSPPGSGEGFCCGEEMINLSQKPGGSRNKSRGKLVNMSI